MSVININSSNFKEEILDFNGISVVDFYADWCGPCKMLAPILDELSDNYDSKIVKFGKLDVESNQDLSNQYQIQGIPNVIIFNKGKMYKQVVGLRTKADYQKIILDLMLG